MKVLFLLHGMPPLPGRPVVGAGLRAFSLGEGLRQRKHRIFYATRHVDLPEEMQDSADQRKKRKPLLLTTITGPVDPPGDPRRGQRPLFALGSSPVDDAADASMDSLHAPPAWLSGQAPSVAIDGLAPIGGPLGSPGNPFAFTETHEVHEIVRRVDPDVVVVEAIEEARRLPEGRFAVVIDLFAPRILEQQFQGHTDEREAVRVLDALQRGDWFLFSNERQKYFHLPLLALAGVDCTRTVGDVVPISCPPELPTFEKPDRPLIVAGGVFWPWADLGPGLQTLLSILDARGDGRIQLYGGHYGITSETREYKDPRDALPQDHPRLDFRGMVPIDRLWQDYRQASFAFDLMVPNPERELNLSFRQIDYLRCGLPIVTAPGQVIAADLLQYGAGWVVDPLDARAQKKLIEDLLDHPEKVARASAGAQRLAKDRFAWDRTISPLDAFCQRPLRRSKQETITSKMARTQADLWEDHEENKRLREGLSRLHEDVDKKDDEIRRQDERIRGLLTNLDRLSASITEVSHFKSATIAYLHETEDASLRDAAELRLELERKELDLTKKNEALDAARRDLARVQEGLRETQAQLVVLEGRYVTRDGEAQAKDDQLRSLRGRLAMAERQVEDRRREVAVRDEALAEARHEVARTEGQMLENLDRAEAFARRALLDLESRLEARRVSEINSLEGRRLHETHALELRAALAQAQVAELLPLRAEATSLRAEVQKKGAEWEALQQVVEATAERLAVATALSDRRGAELGPLRTEVAALRVEAQKKEAELRAELQKKGEELTAVQTRLGAVSERLAEAEALAARLSGDLPHWKAEAASQRAAVGKKAAEVEDLQARLEEAARDGATLAALADRQATALRQIPTLKADAAKKALEIEGLGGQLAEARAALSHMGVEADRLQQEVLAARVRLAGAQAELGKKQAEQEQLRSSSEARQAEMVAGTLAHEERVLRQLDRAEQAAKVLLGEVQDRLLAAQDERGTWKARAEELATSRREAERELLNLRAALDSSETRLQEERTRSELALTEGSRLRDRLSETKVKVADLEVDAGRRALEVAAAREELASAEGRLEQTKYALLGVRADLEKKDRELRDQVAARGRSEEDSASHRARLEAEVGARDGEIGRLKGRIGELEFDRNALTADVGKKTRELEEAQRSLQESLAALAVRRR